MHLLHFFILNIFGGFVMIIAAEIELIYMAGCLTILKTIHILQWTTGMGLVMATLLNMVSQRMLRFVLQLTFFIQL